MHEGRLEGDALQVFEKNRDVAGAAGLEPAIMGPKPIALPAWLRSNGVKGEIDILA